MNDKGRVRTPRSMWVLPGGYLLFVAAGSVLQDREPRPTAGLLVVAAGSIACAAGFLLVAIRLARRSRELERMLFSEATSTAFFATMLFSVTYALLESWLDAPPLSMWIVWSVGMGSWAVFAAILKRRYS